MTFPFRARTISTAVVIPSAIIVAALAVLEYRWSTRVSEATAVRLADSLQMSLINWQKDFFRYFSEIGLSLRIDPVEDSPGDVGQYVRRFSEWKAVAKYPALVSNVFLLRADGTGLRLNVPAGRFEPAEWPAHFAPLRTALQSASVAFLRTRARPRQPPAYSVFGSDDPAAGWRFEPDTLVMAHPVISGSARAPSVDWIAIELNPDEIRNRVLADLSHTYFQGIDGLDYLVAVVGKPAQVLYTSDAGFGDPEPADADGIIDLFGRQHAPPASPVHVFHVPLDTKGPDPSIRISWFPLLHDTPPNTDWRLIVRHRRGGALGAFVVEMRRRDLAIGFGVLLVLAVNMGMLIVTSHRAQRLAQLQMDFVTAVSHELRTPLTVIISGADNMCSGVVATGQQMKQYGSVIGNQARQLYGLVERILLFAAARQGHLRYDLKPLDVRQVVDSALAASVSLIASARASVECEIPAGLPPVAGDAEALAQCLQNLITNALKYAGGERWVGIRASAQEQGRAGKEVRVSVSDRGIGIDPVDLPHIFEPFYRSASVRSAQIHGTGLGLPLSRSIAQAMKGRLEVESSPGRGSTFTLCLPAAAEFPLVSPARLE